MQIVPIEGDVHRSNRNARALHLKNSRREHSGQRFSAHAHAHQRDILHALVALNDLMRHPLDGAQQLLVIKNLRLLVQCPRLPAEEASAEISRIPKSMCRRRFFP